MKKTGVFISEEELDQLKTAQQCSGMCLSGGQPISDPGAMVQRLCEKYKMLDCPINLKDGQFMKDGK